MDRNELELLRNFVSDEIFQFLTMGCDMTQPTHSAHVDPTDPLEAELDLLLLQCSDIFKLDFEQPKQASGSSSTALIPATSANPRKFALPKTEEDILQAKRHAIPASTLKDTKYCIAIWNEWCSHRLTNYGDAIAPLEELNTTELASNLSSFIFEVRKKDGSEFLPDTLHHIISGIQRFLRCNGKPSIDIYKDAEFADFRSCLDSEMKRLQSSGLGSRKRKAEPLSLEEEELLWRKGLLGDGNPQALVDTMVVMNDIYFAFA